MLTRLWKRIRTYKAECIISFRLLVYNRGDRSISVIGIKIRIYATRIVPTCYWFVPLADKYSAFSGEWIFFSDKIDPTVAVCLSLKNIHSDVADPSEVIIVVGLVIRSGIFRNTGNKTVVPFLAQRHSRSAFRAPAMDLRSIILIHRPRVYLITGSVTFCKCFNGGKYWFAALFATVKWRGKYREEEIHCSRGWSGRIFCSAVIFFHRMARGVFPRARSVEWKIFRW